MSSPAWPIGNDSTGKPFPQSFLLGVTGTPSRPITYTTNSTGPSSSRLMDDVDFMTWTGEVIFTSEHLATFKTWYRNTIRYGDVAFVWKDPHTRNTTTYKLLTVNTYSALSQNIWKVGLTIQEVP